MKNRKILLIVLGILLSLSLFVGISYAYYMVTASQTNKNRLASSCISVSLTNEKNDITLNNAYPITNSEGKKLTPYQFTITNTCNIFISYNVNLEMLEGTDLSTDYIKTMVNSEAPYILSSLDSASTTINKSTESRTLAQGSLGSGDSVDYALRLWMDENTPLNNDTQDKSLISKIVVVAQPSTYKPSDYVTTLHDAILVNEYGVKNLDNAISKIKSKHIPDISQPAPISENDISDKGLYIAEDDYGDTYYYRGKVSNNNVYFAGYYWQIVRINGDSSIRLIYNGQEKNASETSKFIKSSKFNNSNDNPQYVGYMYGETSPNSYEEANKNENSSVIKQNNDTRYKENILDKNLNSYIADPGFCNDRSIYIGNGYTTDVQTEFSGYIRNRHLTPNLKCSQLNQDLFTANLSTIGNHALIYPIGLITYDELNYAGISKTINNLSYASSEYDFFTMTPTYYSLGWKTSSMITSSNTFSTGGSVISTYGIRPVINLKSDVEISGGIGTINDPYIVKTN